VLQARGTKPPDGFVRNRSNDRPVLLTKRFVETAIPLLFSNAGTSSLRAAAKPHEVMTLSLSNDARDESEATASTNAGRA
jgi:hypothetical protein